jgi:hypothetical protein
VQEQWVEEAHHEGDPPQANAHRERRQNSDDNPRHQDGDSEEEDENRLREVLERHRRNILSCFDERVNT